MTPWGHCPHTSGRPKAAPTEGWGSRADKDIGPCKRARRVVAQASFSRPVGPIHLLTPHGWGPAPAKGRPQANQRP